MKTLIDNEVHHVVYIEYHGAVPHQVYTAQFSEKCIDGPQWILTNWFDFFPNNKDKGDIRYYNAGGGGKAIEIDAPHWVDGCIGKYWIDDKIASFKGTPINGEKLLTPKRIKTYFRGSSINPFKIGEETYSREYCEVCGNEGTEICWDHIEEVEDDNGDYILRYKDDLSPYH